MQSLRWASAAASLVILLGAAGGGPAPQKEPGLQGSWIITSVETSEGKYDIFKGGIVEFGQDGKNASWTQDGQTKKGACRINPAGKPKEIDITPENSKQTLECIYQIEKNSLKLCLPAIPSDGRPTELSVGPGTHHFLVNLERAKK
jgi:uncharacterized protein (TIGR03067 family)